ncbi:MAG: hypothetical protein RIK87_14135 [Fuerstiella sp.]
MSVTINCPNCSSGLKLPDRRLLGRKGKCPKCAHRFILEEPDEVELELVDPPENPLPPQQPMVGTSAKWVPDDPTGAADPVFPLADVPLPSVSSAPADPFAQAASASANPFDFAAASSPGNSASTEVAGSAAAPPMFSVDSPPDPANSPAVAAPADGGSITNRLSRRRTKKRTGPIVIGVGTAVFAFCMLGLWWQHNQQARQAAEREAAAAVPAENTAWNEQKQQLAISNEDAKALSPTAGGPIPMEYMPFTPHLICHLRPAEIWASNRSKQTFVATLGDLAIWLGKVVEDTTMYPPQDIEELTFAVNFGPRTSVPDVAAVVRLRSEPAASRHKFESGRRVLLEDLNQDVFEAGGFCYVAIDENTFAVAPVGMADELVEAKTYSRQPSVEAEVLLAESDRQRQVTLIFDVMNIDTHREYIFAEMETFADRFIVWLGKDIRTISWSLHLGEQTLFMETLLHSSNESSPMRVQRYLQNRLTKLPELLLETVRFMKPETVGYRDMIGRLPVMMQAVILGTSSQVGTGYVRLVTLLPEKAGPNLAAASLYAWDQSLRTDFDGPSPVASSQTRLPDRIVDRLKQVTVYVDFRNTPLQEALEYISDEIQVPIEINGEGLKQSALTQNMKQNHNLGDVPAMRAFDAILSNPDYRGAMVMSVDEEAKKIIVTSRPAATADNLPIFDTKQ